MNKRYFWKSAAQYIFFFFLASFAGYMWEIIIFLVKEGTLRNRGFLYGPWLPVYGVGAVLMLLLLRRFQSHPVRVFFLSMLTGSLLELLIGWFLDTIWNLRYWDYSNNFLNLNGYICLYSVLGFGIAGALWVCLFARFAARLWRWIPVCFQRILLTLLLVSFITDCAAALILPNIGNGITF